jgi:MFS family permease
VKEIHKIYAIHFLAGLTNAASVTFTIYFLSHGLSQAQIGLMFGAFMIVMSVFNIPTGAIADIYGHKISVFVGLIFQALSFLLFFASPNFIGFLIGFILSGIGLAFQTGAISSLIYEILKKENLHKSAQQVFGRANAYFLLGAVIASPIGSIVYKHNPSAPYFASFLFFLIAAAVTIFIKWDFVVKDVDAKKYFNVLTEGTKLTFKNKVLVGIIVVGSALTIERLVFNQNIIQPYILKIGIDVSYLGFIMAFISALGALVSYNSQKITKYLGTEKSLVLLVFIPSISLIILSFITSLFALLFIPIFAVFHTLRDPIFSHITQEEVEDNKRATMSSTIAFFTSIIAGIALPYFGKGIDSLGMSSLMIVLSIFTIIVGLTGFIIITKEKKVISNS